MAQLNLNYVPYVVKYIILLYYSYTYNLFTLNQKMYHIIIITIISIFDKQGGLGVARFSCLRCAKFAPSSSSFWNRQTDWNILALLGGLGVNVQIQSSFPRQHKQNRNILALLGKEEKKLSKYTEFIALV